MAQARTRSASRVADVSTVDVAKRARVSLGTVSRVINDHPKVAAELRRRVWVASRELGFVPKSQNRCIALITGRRNPKLAVGYVSVMVSLVSQYLAENGYAVELIDIENLELACKADIQGAIGVVFDERLANLREVPNLPLLTINKPMTDLGIHSVRADHYQQSVIATQHLLDRGHRRIAFLAIEPEEWGSRERRRGYEDTLRQAGIMPEPMWIQYTIGRPIYDILGRWTQRDVTAILNFSEDASLEVLHVLSNILKLRLGQDISTISLEDLPVYQYFSPPQTTVSQPLGELARLAVENMLRLCDRNQPNGKKIIDVCLPTSLLERDSVATLAEPKPVSPGGRS